MQSSNNLYILRATHLEVGERGGLSTIAQCNDLLELVPSKSDALQYLRSIIPVYIAMYAAERTKDGVKLQDLLADSPFSENEIRNGLVEICACEFGECYWIPTAKELKETWSSFINSMTAEGASIDKSFITSHAKSLVVDEGYSGEIFDVMMRRICCDDDIADQASIDSNKCVAWIGSILFEANEELPVSKERLLSTWKDQLPEVWRNQADLNLLLVNNVCHLLPAPTNCDLRISM